MSFDVVFTQDGTAHAAPGASNPLNRIEIGPDVAETELRALVESGDGR